MRTRAVKIKKKKKHHKVTCTIFQSISNTQSCHMKCKTGNIVNESWTTLMRLLQYGASVLILKPESLFIEKKYKRATRISLKRIPFVFRGRNIVRFGMP